MEDIREKINKRMYRDRDNLTREYQQARLLKQLKNIRNN